MLKNTLGLQSGYKTDMVKLHREKNLQTQGKTKCPEEADKKQLGQLKIHNEFYIHSTYKTPYNMAAWH
jgi:hypothetical protein